MLIFNSSHNNSNHSKFCRFQTPCSYRPQFQLNCTYKCNLLTGTNSKSFRNDTLLWTWVFLFSFANSFGYSIWWFGEHCDAIKWAPSMFAINYNLYDIESLSSHFCNTTTNSWLVTRVRQGIAETNHCCVLHKSTCLKLKIFWKLNLVSTNEYVCTLHNNCIEDHMES